MKPWKVTYTSPWQCLKPVGSLPAAQQKLSIMEVINFSTNWNNKLDCKCFTTLRLKNPKKYQLNKQYLINLKKNAIKKAEIIAIKTIYFKDINEYIASLDTGYSLEETKNIILKMYPNIKTQTQPFYFILLKTI